MAVGPQPALNFSTRQTETLPTWGQGNRTFGASDRLEARHDKPALGAAAVDQLLSGETGTGALVGKVALHGTRADAHEVGSIRDGPAG